MNTLRLIRLALFATALPCLASPLLTFQGNRVEITNIPRGGTVALLVVSHERQPFHLRVNTDEATLTDADRDGVILYDVPNGIRRKSVWIAAELPSGRTAVFTPAGPGAVDDAPSSALRGPERVALAGDRLEMLYIRPAVGAWRLTVVDSGARDADEHPDGFATLSLPHLRAVGNAGASPASYTPGDVVLAVDVVTLSVQRFHEVR